MSKRRLLYERIIKIQHEKDKPIFVNSLTFRIHTTRKGKVGRLLKSLYDLGSNKSAHFNETNR